MKLYAVTFNHPRGGQREVTIASDSDDLKVVEDKCRDAGLDVASVTRVVEAVDPVDAPEPTEVKKEPAPTGRIYGKSAEGPRRNKDEMAQDRRIEELIERKGYDLPTDADLVADDLQAELEALPDAPKAVK